MKISDLPKGFPSIIIHHCDADRREPGYILVSLGKGVRAISEYSEFEALVALDRYGQVTWFCETRGASPSIPILRSHIQDVGVHKTCYVFWSVLFKCRISS